MLQRFVLLSTTECTVLKLGGAAGPRHGAPEPFLGINIQPDEDDLGQE